MPRTLRPHERLVVEAGGNERRDQIVDRADIEVEARPAVLTLRLQAFIQLDLRGSQVGNKAGRVATDCNQRVRLFGARRENAARPVVLERSAHQVHTIGEQSGSQGIALNACVALSIKCEIQHAGTIDPAGAVGANSPTINTHKHTPTKKKNTK